MFRESRVLKAANGCQQDSVYKGYIGIARIDHWVKNFFMILGIALAIFHNPANLSWQSLSTLIIAIFTACLIASSNYVLNEIQDATYDRFHPIKKHRPIPSGMVNVSLAYVEWIMLAIIGIILASTINRPFLYISLFFLIMGILYNVKPIRMKDFPILDVLSESINNPIRLLLGWFALVPNEIPPISLLLAYWMIGAFFMTTKRFSEYRTINNLEVASIYRKSFKYYTEKRLLISMIYYVALFSLFFGLFITKYHYELILSAPLIIGFISWYTHVSYKENSVVQNPEYLYREKGLILFGVLCMFIFIILLFINIPFMYELFKVQPSQLSPLWTF
jgi:4-hydroxybenzoate polyprenyltransferase